MTQRREFIGRLIVAGPTRTVSGEADGLVVTAAAIREAIDAGRFRGLACFADHALDGPSSVRRLLGVWQGVAWDEATNAAVGRLVAYETELTRPVLELLEQWVGEGREGEKGGRGAGEKGGKGEGERADLGVERADVGVERPDVGVSLVFYPRLAADGRTVVGMAMVESADVVMFPASVGSRIVGEITNYELGITNEERRAATPVVRRNDEGRMTGDEGDGAGYGPAARSVALGMWGAGGIRNYELGIRNEEGPVADETGDGVGEESADYADWADSRKKPVGESVASHSLLSTTPYHTMTANISTNTGRVEPATSSHSQLSIMPHHAMTANTPTSVGGVAQKGDSHSQTPTAPHHAMTATTPANTGRVEPAIPSHSQLSITPHHAMTANTPTSVGGVAQKGDSHSQALTASHHTMAATTPTSANGVGRKGDSHSRGREQSYHPEVAGALIDAGNMTRNNTSHSPLGSDPRNPRGSENLNPLNPRNPRGSENLNLLNPRGSENLNPHNPRGNENLNPRNPRGSGNPAAVPALAGDAPARSGRAQAPAAGAGGAAMTANRDMSISKLSMQSNQQEYEQMTQQTDGTIAPRVALVRGAADGRQATDGQAVDAWLDALRSAAAEAVIRASGLPPVVQERLGGERYETAEAVGAAVERARAELAALNESGVVQLGARTGMAQTGMSALHMRDGLDEARELVAFFFGAAGAPTPPANMRSFADLYVALTGDTHFRGVFDGGRVLFSGATTATLPNLAVDAMNRVIAEQFAALEHYRWYERVTDVAPNDGRLHAMKWLTLGGIGDLPAVSEGAAYTELSVADAKESAAFVKRGGYVGITREMIKNGDIMQMQAIPRALAAAAVRTRSAAVGAIFTANSGVGPTLAQDSKALFHLDHDNLATTALGTDAAAWRAARHECFRQVELGSGKPLGIFPRFLLVPADLYDTALSILGYGEGMPTVYSPEAQGRGFADPRPIPLVVPEWTDAGDWAYIVDPALFPVIQMSYSQAPGGRRHPIPELFAVVSETSGLMFSNDVLPIKVRDEFALGVNGPRGIGKRNVA